MKSDATKSAAIETGPAGAVELVIPADTSEDRPPRRPN